MCVLNKDYNAMGLDLEVTTDIYDELIYGQTPFTHEMFDQFFKELKSWGTRRIKFIDHGMKKHGWWDNPPADNSLSGLKTFENVGDMLKVAVEAAHSHNLEIYALIKPFDMAIQGFSYGEGTEDAIAKGKMSRIGGPVGWCSDFIANHPELLMARKHYGPAQNKTFHQIDLVKENDESCDVSCDDIKLYVSDDNVEYQLYDGKIEVEELVEDYPVWEHSASGGRLTGQTRKSRVIRLKNLAINNKYFVVEVENQSESFANSLINLIHVFGEKGEERYLTYGGMSRQVGISEWGDFRTSGVEYDRYPSFPTASKPGWNGFEERYVLDRKATYHSAGSSFIAVARGKDRGALALSPSFPEVREYWLSWIQDAIDAGVDGVELRVRNHKWHFSWQEYGFEKPVVEEYKDRYGVDILESDDFDRMAFREIRGEAYSEFYRQARNLLNSHNKKMILHITDSLEMPPERGTPMEVFFNWKLWIDERLADAVTLKNVSPDSDFGKEVIRYAKENNLKVSYCPYCCGIMGDPKKGMEIVPPRVEMAKKTVDAFDFYESAAVIKVNPKIEMTQPRLKDYFRKEFS